MNTFIKTCLGGVLLMFLIFSCEKDSIFETNSPSASIAPVNQADFEGVDQMFDYLANNPQLVKASLSGQFAEFKQYADDNGIDFDFQQAISVQQDSYNPNQTRFGAKSLFEVQKLNEMMEGTELGSQTAENILKYRQNLAENHEVLSKDEYEAIEGYAQVLEYLNVSQSAKRYYNVISKGNEVNKTWACFRAQFAAFAASASCAGSLATVVAAPTAPITCAAAAIAWANVAIACNPGGNEPCYNSLDPCCGNDCGPGYTCTGVNAVCVLSAGGDSCNGILCPAGFRCLDGDCVEL